MLWECTWGCRLLPRAGEKEASQSPYWWAGCPKIWATLGILWVILQHWVRGLQIDGSEAGHPHKWRGMMFPKNCLSFIIPYWAQISCQGFVNIMFLFLSLLNFLRRTGMVVSWRRLHKVYDFSRIEQSSMNLRVWMRLWPYSNEWQISFAIPVHSATSLPRRCM